MSNLPNPTAVCATCAAPIEYLPAGANPEWHPPYWTHVGLIPDPPHAAATRRLVAAQSLDLVSLFGPAVALCALWLIPSAVVAGVL